MAESGAVNGIWKWIAGSILVVTLAFLTPSIGWFIDSRERVSKVEFEQVRQRQVEVLIRLGVIEEQIDANAELIREIQRILEEHREEQR